MGYREYTHCVQAADYVDNMPPPDLKSALLQGLTDPLAIAKWLASVCPYLLGGKLICLGDGKDQCAIGHITKFDRPKDSILPFEDIDDDFSISILLLPHSLDEMTTRSYVENYEAVVNDGEQGWLLEVPPDMPIPHEPWQGGNPPGGIPSPRYQGHFTEYPDNNYVAYDPSQSPYQVSGSDGQPFYVPDLHLECEGSRIHDVCNAISGVQGPASAFCEVPVIGWLTCLVIDVITLPVMLLAVGIAWAGAHDGNETDAEVGGSGKLEFGDLIVVTGRWVCDAGHSGWNELHPVKTIQLIPSADYGADFANWRTRWCEATAHCPPYAPSGTKPTDMTPAQNATYEAQLDLTNQWIYHPLIDGCDPQPGDSGEQPETSTL